MEKAMMLFFEDEVKQTERWLKSEWCKTDKDKRESVWYAIQRCLGVAQFVQTIPGGLSFQEIEAHYEATKEKLENLL